VFAIYLILQLVQNILPRETLNVETKGHAHSLTLESFQAQDMATRPNVQFQQASAVIIFRLSAEQLYPALSLNSIDSKSILLTI